MTERLEAAAWVLRTMKMSEDVRVLFTTACATRGHESVVDLARLDPEVFDALYDAAFSMLEEIPEDQLRSLGKGKP